METLLINEQFVSQFKHWREGQMRTGMRFRNNLFESVATFDYRQRQQVFDLAERLAESGKEVVVTAASTRYTVWINLRAKSKASLSRLSPVPVQVSPAPVQAARSSSAQELLVLEAFLSA
jgi:hypothetical protein